MTKEELYKTLKEIAKDYSLTIFWEYISSVRHPTKKNGEVYNKLTSLTTMHNNPELTELLSDLYNMIEEEVDDANCMALTEKGVQFFNQLHHFLVDPSNP